jgi:DNA-binding CsgD family transcriptional regulator
VEETRGGEAIVDDVPGKHLDQSAIVLPLDQSAIVTRIVDQIVAEFKNPRDPRWILLRSLSRKNQRENAARQIAATMSTRFANPAVRHELAGRAGARQWLREIVFPAALLEAAGERFTERRIRLGKRWVKDAGGRRVAKVQPMQLSVTAARRWLIQRARTLAEESIIGSSRSAAAALRRRPSKREEELQRLLVAGTSRADAALKMQLDRSTIDNRARRLRSKGWPTADSPGPHQSDPLAPKPPADPV